MSLEMKTLSLPDLNGADPKRLAQARRHIHNGALWLARLANCFRPPEADNAQMRLRWLDQSRSLSTQTFNDKLTLQLRLPQLHLQFMENGNPMPHVFDMEDRTPAEAEAWILVELLHRGLERERFTKTLPFDIAAPMTGDTDTYAPAEYEGELAKLTDWLAGGAAVLEQVSQSADGLWLAPEPLAFSVVTSSGGKPIRTGFSLGDERLGEPSFFVGPQRNGTVQSLRPDAVLTASQIHKGALSADAIAASLKDAAQKRSA